MYMMKLTLKIKLLPSTEQRSILLDTIKEANTVCDAMSKIAFEKKLFNQYKLHHEVYYAFKNTTRLSAQVIVRCISKVTDAYKLDKKVLRRFRPLGAIAYDSRILSYKGNIASIWCVGGRQKMEFICHNEKYLPYIKGEADLVYKKGKFFLFQTVEIPDQDIEDVEEFIGVDFGITDLACLDDGTKYSSQWLNEYREKRLKIRKSIQSKGTRGSRNLSKRLKGKEKTTASIINHTIAKKIVEKARFEKVGIALEELTNIRKRSSKRNKAFRSKLGKWSFSQLRKFIEYKSEMNGIRCISVHPHYTSQTCSGCKYIGKRTNKVFKCTNEYCTVDKLDADVNAAKNISVLGAAVNQPGKSDMYSCTVHIVD